MEYENCCEFSFSFPFGESLMKISSGKVGVFEFIKQQKEKWRFQKVVSEMNLSSIVVPLTKC